MKFSLWAVYVFLLFLCGNTLGVPIARMRGCGQNKDLSPQERKLCCKEFKMDCAVKTPKPVRPAEVEKIMRRSEALDSTRRHSIGGRTVQIRLLGEPCNNPNEECAVGLHCAYGKCLRTRSASHLRALIERGKIVKQEEEANLSFNSGQEGDPSGEQKPIEVQGQAVRLDDYQSGEQSEKTIRERRAEHKGEEGAPSKNLMEEEDELAANIADLLSSKLGVSLDNVEMKSIRNLIAGTLDERTEREDEVEESDTKLNVQLRTQFPADISRAALREPKESQKESPEQPEKLESFYEPLVQCESEKESHGIRRGLADAAKTIRDNVENYVHVSV